MIEVVLAVLGGGAVLGIALASRKKRCPSCNQRALEIVYAMSSRSTGPRDPNKPVDLSTYHCTACRTEWRSRDFGPLIPREADEAGVREVPPTARTLPPKREPS